MNKLLIAALLLAMNARGQTVGEEGLPIGGRLDVSVTMSGAAPNTDKTFVGHYGLSFDYSDAQVVQARMEGPVEIIQLHYFLDQKLNRYDPKPGDWRPEGFTKHKLVQVVIAPLSLSNYATLEDLIRDKAAAMDAQGLKYELSVQKDDFVLSALEPIGTHSIGILEPYCLFQTYYRSKSLSFILSYGCDAGEVFTARRIKLAITDFINAEKPKPPRPSVTRALLDNPSAIPVFIGIMAKKKAFRHLLLSMTLMLAFFLGPRLRRLFSAGIHGTLASLTGAFAAWLIARGAFMLSLRGLDPTAVVAIVLLLQAFAVAYISFKRHGAGWLEPSWRVFPGLLVPAVGVILMSADNSHLSAPELLAAYPRQSFLGALHVCAIAGWWWGLFSKAPGVPWRTVLHAILVLCTLSAQNADAQGIPVNRPVPDYAEMLMASDDARKRLASRGDTIVAIKKRVTDAALEAGTAYDYQRVEVTGMWSDDDTNKFREGLFDLQIKPSMLNERELLTPTKRLAMRLKSHLLLLPYIATNPLGRFFIDNALPNIDAQAEDALLATQDISGKLTERAQDVVAALKGKRVNEVVAHSWGTQIIYNAILEGKISAPRRLILIGAPDVNDLKWQLLAKHTGTEVIYFRHHDDLVGIVGALQPRSVTDRKARRKWADASENREKAIALNPHNRIGSWISLQTQTGGGHDRHQYYQDLERMSVNGDNLLTATAVEMAAAQDQRLRAQAEADFNRKFEEMKRVVAIENMRQREESRRLLEESQRRFREMSQSANSRIIPPASPGAHLGGAAPARRPIDFLILDLSKRACATPATVTDELAAQVVAGSDLFQPGGLRNGLDRCELAVMDALLDLVKGRYGASSATRAWILKIASDNGSSASPASRSSTEDHGSPPSNGSGSGCIEEYIPELGKTIRSCPR